MKSTKETNSAQPIDLQKPVVKEFVDKNQQLSNFLEIRLPHVPYCIPKMICVFESKDKTEVAYRVNWTKKSNSAIESSQYVKILIKPDGYEILSVK